MKVIKEFTCKVTKQRFNVGDNYDGLRGDELREKGFIEAKEKKEVTHTPKTKVTEPKKKKDVK
jgi:hypothetical protein